MQPLQMQARPPSPACPRCGTPATWYAQASSWGCDRCQAPVGPQIMAPVAAGSDAGAIVVKVVVFIVMVIVIILIKVGVRSAFR